MLDINLEPGRASITREKGIPRQKVRFSVRPADDDLAIIKKAAGLCTPNMSNAEKVLKAQEVEEAKAKLLAAEAKLKPLRGKGDDLEKAARKARDEAKRDYERAKSALAACTGPDSNKVALGDDPRDLQHFLQNYRHLNELVIGKAMSYAAPGSRFEILLQPRHSL